MVKISKKIDEQFFYYCRESQFISPTRKINYFKKCVINSYNSYILFKINFSKRNYYFPIKDKIKNLCLSVSDAVKSQFHDKR